MSTHRDNNELQFPSDGTIENASSELVHSLLRVVHIARYRTTTIVRTVCVAAILGAVYFAFAPRFYDSTAKLLIERCNQDQVASLAEQPTIDNTVASHREIVISPVVIQGAIDMLLPEQRIDFAAAPPSEWNDRIAERLTARVTRKTSFIEVRYRSRSPESASAVVSTVIQSYLQFIDRVHKGSSGDAIAMWTRKCDEVDRSLGAKRAELQSCRDRIGSLAVKPDDGVVEPTIQRALRLNEALLEAQQRRLKLEASYASINVAITKGEDLQQHLLGLEEMVGRQMLISALGLTPQDLALVKAQEQKLLDARAELQRVEPFYGPSHPKVSELHDRMRTIEQYLAAYQAQSGERLASFGGGEFGTMLVKMVAQSVAQAREQERQLQVAYEAQRQQARAQSDDMQRMQDVEREIARLEVEKDALVTKIATIDTNQLRAPIQATVVQEPLPDDEPDSPQLRIIIALSLLGGLFGGGLIAYVQDALDDRFASPEEMSAQLGVAVLSMVRRLAPLDADGLGKVHAFVSPNAAEAESFRTLRTALTLSPGATDRIAVSSAEPGDGKTTITANLAVSFAHAGKRTIVIDADLRKPGMTALMGLKGLPGVSDVLCGHEQATAAAALVHHTALPNLDVLPAGLRRPNPAELLGSPNFVELLAWAEANYEQILVDCPPVLAVSDAQIIGRLVDGAILVVQPQKNHRRLVARACHCFSATGSTVIGIVANGLSPQAGRGYGYGYGYGYGEGYGYGHDTDQEASVPPEGTATDDATGEEVADILAMTANVDTVREIERKDDLRRGSRRSNRAA